MINPFFFYYSCIALPAGCRFYFPYNVPTQNIWRLFFLKFSRHSNQFLTPNFQYQQYPILFLHRSTMPSPENIHVNEEKKSITDGKADQKNRTFLLWHDRKDDLLSPPKLLLWSPLTSPKKGPSADNNHHVLAWRRLQFPTHFNLLGVMWPCPTYEIVVSN